MKIKKEFIGTTIYSRGRKIYLGEIVDEALIEMLKNEYPRYLEEDKPKKKAKKESE
tara:strand:- start:16141 stop:16308 length:168 start_codon:yes stop_codon:yes gene_type:complete